jgi:hypothetical protein
MSYQNRQRRRMQRWAQHILARSWDMGITIGEMMIAEFYMNADLCYSLRSRHGRANRKPL